MGVQETQTIVLSVQFSAGYTDDKQSPKIKAIHPSINDHTVKIGLAEQMENIANLWTQYRWAEMHMKPETRALLKLEKQGFERVFCEEALDECKNLDRATNFLQENIGLLRQLASKSSGNLKNTNSPSTSSGNQRAAFAKLMKRKHPLIPDLVAQNKTQLAIAMALRNSSMNIEKAVELVMDTGGFIENAPQALASRAEGYNFILDLITYLICRMNSVMGHCLICDNFITVEGYEGFDPQTGIYLSGKNICQLMLDLYIYIFV